ncbi:hypothetical protein AA0111_g12480 [Alternaria arborescens]|uniref:hypothetical protein n=1 Tax=Alternaria arborescens TaxID=156630 RepID=UPI001074D9DE|nr:hypothetical protein AA0111_g12480 [Alternaria arborescens]RYO12738.1 hypothetical protein AA0111_g12480 [Alternaria arborescens]
MWVQGVCNLLATLSKPPWTKPLNWDLHITIDGEERIPFYLYVTYKNPPPCTSSQDALLSRFSQLSTELQLRVLDFCSAPTLYQLMHTPMLRIEAAKQFWSEPDTYYLVEAHWLFGGGHSGYTCYDLSFMAHVQNVEIEYDLRSDDKIAPIQDDVVELDYDKAREFWRTFRISFPLGKKVVVNKNWESLTIRYQNDEPIACSLKVLVETCPIDLEISPFVLVEVSSGGEKRTAPPVAKNWHRVLYRLADNGEWRKVITPNFERKTVLMPPKRFYGPVGEFKGLLHKQERIQLQLTGLGAVAIEALDRHYFGKENPEPFHCPMFGCDVYFEQAGQWTQHAAETHRVDMFIAQPKILPRALQHSFEERKNNLMKEVEARRKKFRRIFNDWNEEGGKKRRELERGWIHQLDNDEVWNTGMKGADSELWELFKDMMDPTWCRS